MSAAIIKGEIKIMQQPSSRTQKHPRARTEFDVTSILYGKSSGTARLFSRFHSLSLDAALRPTLPFETKAKCASGLEQCPSVLSNVRRPFSRLQSEYDSHNISVVKRKPEKSRSACCSLRCPDNHYSLSDLVKSPRGVRFHLLGRFNGLCIKDQSNHSSRNDWKETSDITLPDSFSSVLVPSSSFLLAAKLGCVFL